MTTTRRLGARMLRNELNSEAFLSGLQHAISYTGRTGSETSFELSYLPDAGAFHYGMWISVGNDHSVSTFKPLNLPATIAAYEQETGETLPHSRNPEWKKRCTQLTQEEQTAAHAKSIPWLATWNILNPERAMEFPYPDGRDVERKRERVYAYTGEGKQYVAVHVHTHPQSLVVPSPNDLKFLHRLREDNMSLSKEDSTLTDRSLAPNPISLIAAAKPISWNGYRILLVEERTASPLPQDTDFPALAQGFADLRDPGARYRAARNDQGRRDVREAVRRSYHVLYAEYDPDLTSISLDRGSFWRELDDTV